MINDWLNDYQHIILYGIIVNFIATLGYGVYKAINVDAEKILLLVEKYPPKDETLKLIILWFLPFLGFFYVLKEVWLLQRFLNHGFSITDYIEYRLKQKYKES